jgi:hypothetical protein
VTISILLRVGQLRLRGRALPLPQRVDYPVLPSYDDWVLAASWYRVYAVKGKLTDFYSLTFERSYRDKGGDWKYTKSFSIEDLPKLGTLIHMAETAVSEIRSQDGTAQ